MNKCPKCGADEYIGVPGEFRCGSRIFPISKQFEQNKLCRELCDLRKWREVVMRHARLGEYAWGQLYWASSIPALQTFGEQRPHQDFDAAVRKAME